MGLSREKTSRRSKRCLYGVETSKIWGGDTIFSVGVPWRFGGVYQKLCGDKDG